VGIARVTGDDHGWITTYELEGGQPVTTGPYASRELAEERRAFMLDEVLERTRAQGLDVVIRVEADGSCVLVASNLKAVEEPRGLLRWPGPTPAEDELVREIGKPTPWHKSPRTHVAELVVGYREYLVEQVLEPLAESFEPHEAARVRRAIKVIRGEVVLDDIEGTRGQS
jgi:hypothetical protein